MLQRSSCSSRLFLLVHPLLLFAACPCLSEQALPARSGLTIHFLEPEAARDAIVDDSTDHYFRRLTQLEMAAKTGAPVSGDTRKERIEETRRRYREGVREFTEREQEALRWYLSKLDPILRERYAHLADLPWSFVKVSPHIEAGLPHTRGPHIVLSEPVLAALVAGKENGAAGELAIRHMGVLLLHEQLHVLQRKEPELFEDLYTRLWNFRRIPRISGAEKLKPRIVMNPDGPDTVWLFPVGEGEWVWPLIVFPEGMTEERATLRRMQPVAVAIEEREGGEFRVKTDETGAPIVRPLSEAREYMRAFYPSQYVFHPNEASADLFARMVAYDALGADENVPEEQRQRIEKGFAPIRQWFAKNLAK